MWAPRLPFGYVESPRRFCSLMEAIADVLRIEEASIRVVDRSETHVHLAYRGGAGQMIHFSCSSTTGWSLATWRR